MDRENGARRPASRGARKLMMLIAGFLIVLAIVLAIQGILRGTGEAVGIEEAAPGDSNAGPVPDNH